MAASADVRDILDLEPTTDEFMTKDSLFKESKKNKLKKYQTNNVKKPEGMHRELWGLLWTDHRDGAPLVPSDTTKGYKQMKAKIGRSKVRPWCWMPFTNPAREDNVVFYHWRRTTEEGKEYPFAKFNKSVDIPAYSDLEYRQHLHNDDWTRDETDYLFRLCDTFDLRFVVMCDRYDRETYPNRSIEDLKQRFYFIANTLKKLRGDSTDSKIRVYDADHERHRKEQLEKLYSRTQEQIEEEETLMQELKKIEQRKKEREKKTQDLQKLISAAESNSDIRARAERKATKKKLLLLQKNKEGKEMPPPQDTSGIKFTDLKASGVSLRSQRMKMPTTVGLKKVKAIEQVLEELGIEFNPMPTDEIVQNFNDLRQDIVLLYELKLALANCEYELQTLRHRFDTLAPGKMPDIGTLTMTPTHDSLISVIDEDVRDEFTSKKKLAESVDVGSPMTPNKKRKAALEQGNILRKIKQKL